MALFKMTRATGHALNLPAHSIRTVTSVRKGSKADFPRARSHIRYDLGQGPMQALLVDDYDSLWDRLVAAVPSAANWVEASLWEREAAELPEDERDRFRFERGAVSAIEGLDPEDERNAGAQALIYLNLFGQQPIAIPSFDDANDLTEWVEAEIAMPAPDQIIEDFRQPPRSARVAAPAKPGAAPKAPTRTRAVPVPAKGPPKPSGVKKAAKPATKSARPASKA